MFIYSNRILRNKKNLWVVYDPVVFLDGYKVDAVSNIDKFMQKKKLNPDNYYSQFIDDGNIILYSNIRKMKMMLNDVLKSGVIIDHINLIDDLHLIYFSASSIYDAYSKIKKFNLIPRTNFVSELKKLISKEYDSMEISKRSFDHNGNKFSFTQSEHKFIIAIKIKDYNKFKRNLCGIL